MISGTVRESSSIAFFVILLSFGDKFESFSGNEWEGEGDEELADEFSRCPFIRSNALKPLCGNFVSSNSLCWFPSSTSLICSLRLSILCLLPPSNAKSIFLSFFMFILRERSTLVVVCGDIWPRLALLLLSQLAGGVAGENALPAIRPPSIGGLRGDSPPLPGK